MIISGHGARGQKTVARKRNLTMRLTLTIVASLCLMAVFAAAQEPTDTQPAAAAALEAQAPASAPNPIILRVNGEPVYAIEISMIMQTLQSQLIQRGEPVDQRELAQVATQRIVEQKLLAQESRRFGITADELDVARAAQAGEEQAGGRAELETKLKASGSNYEQYLGIIRELETMKAFVTQQIMPNVKVTDEEIAAYYEANSEAFDAEERAHAYHIIFIVGEDAAPEILAAKRKNAEAARQRALKGDEDFNTICQELSEGPSAPTGGDLGWVNRGQLVEPLSEAIFSLEPGDISEVVQSRFGFHVATISDLRPAERISLEDASEQVRFFLGQDKATEAVGKLLETLIASANVENLIGGDVPANATGTN